MPMYVGLYKLTEKGAADIKQAPQRMQDAMKAWEAMGGTVRVALATMGEFDYVSVGEAPNDEVAAAHAAALSAQGFVTTQSLRGFAAAEFAALLAKLPCRKKAPAAGRATCFARGRPSLWPPVAAQRPARLGEPAPRGRGADLVEH